MQNRQFHRLIYQMKHRYLTMNNAVMAIAAVIAISWAWASVGVVQKNYALQAEVDDKRRQKQLVELQAENLAYEQRYYKSDEYLALEARERQSLAEPGEKVLVLPPNTPAAKAHGEDGAESTDTQTPAHDLASEPTNLQQWMNFLFGGNKNSVS